MTEGCTHILFKTTMSNGFVFPHCPHCSEQVVPDTKWCPACGKPFGAEVLARWKAEEPPHFGSARWALISMGLDPVGRTVGTVIAWGLLVFVGYAWLVYAMSTVSAEPVLALTATGMVLFSAYDIWAFTHGKATQVNYIRHEATLTNTGWRTAGLALDVLVMVIGVTVFWRGL